MRGIVSIIAAVVLSLPASAGLVTVSDFSAEYAGYTLVGDMDSAFVNNYKLPNTSVHSAAYTNGTGYVYLYQVVNQNVKSTLHRFSAADFYGLTPNTVQGYITGDVAGFLAGGVAPVSGDLVDETVGFSLDVAPSLHSLVMFVESTYKPDVIDGFLQNSGQAWGQVLGAVVPEPATMGLLMLGSLFAVRTRKK